MNIIKDKEFQGERPLFFQQDLRLENIKILNGESAIKEGHNIVAVNSYFNGKYPFWHINDFEIENCTFDTGARAAIWYSNNLKRLSTNKCGINDPLFNLSPPFLSGGIKEF